MPQKVWGKIFLIYLIKKLVASIIHLKRFSKNINLIAPPFLMHSYIYGSRAFIAEHFWFISWIWARYHPWTNQSGAFGSQSKGMNGGKKKGLSPEAKKEAETALILHKQKKSSVEIAGVIGVSRATVYRYLEEMGQEWNLQTAKNQ